MLHCPRCSGPLEVAQQPELRTHQPIPTTTTTTTTAAATSQQSAAQDLNKGSCPAGNSCPHYQQQQQQQSSSSLATSNQAVNYLSGGGIILQTPPSQSRSQHINNSLNSAASNLLQQQQQAQQPRLQQHPVLIAPTLMLPTTNNQAPQPLFLTSTINQLAPLQPSMAISTFCHPATPAIVVGSTSPPFFHHQQQQQPANQFQHHHHNHHQSCWQQNVRSHHHHHQLQPTVELPTAATIHQILERNKQLLEQTNWYYPSMKWNESSDLLCKSDPGTFLVRDSADPNFLFSLSVQRESDGPTSVRIQFQRGKFKLDAEESIRDLMPEFGSVVELIEHYMARSSSTSSEQQQKQVRKEEFGAKEVFVDAFGKLSSPICLRKPLYKQVPSLAHLARLSALKKISEENCGETSTAVDRLDLPKGLAQYLTNYPHKV